MLAILEVENLEGRRGCWYHVLLLEDIKWAHKICCHRCLRIDLLLWVIHRQMQTGHFACLAMLDMDSPLLSRRGIIIDQLCLGTSPRHWLVKSLGWLPIFYTSDPWTIESQFTIGSAISLPWAVYSSLFFLLCFSLIFVRQTSLIEVSNVLVSDCLGGQIFAYFVFHQLFDLFGCWAVMHHFLVEFQGWDSEHLTACERGASYSNWNLFAFDAILESEERLHQRIVL